MAQPFDDSPPREIALGRLVLVGLLLVAAVIYFKWRVTVLDPAHPLFSALVFAGEVASFLWSLIFVLTNLRFPHRRPLLAPPGLAVDVLVTSFNEPVGIVRRTLVAARAITYPHRTWLLDDGNRAEMKALAEELGCDYLARQDNRHAKAGNLNHALAHVTGEFIALFDADHVAHPGFLDSTLGYFVDRRLAFVQTPQEFTNFESFQHYGPDREYDPWSEHSLFYRVIQRGRDRFGATMLCGCAAVMRRAALDEIGGFATGTVTEDMHTSLRLHAAGWKSLSHPETLSAGLAPFDAASFARQRLRWAQGSMQVFRRERLFRNPGLSFMQGVSYALHVFANLEGWYRPLVHLLPALVLMTDLSPLHAQLGPYLGHILPFLLLSVLAFEEMARGYGRLLRYEIYSLARSPTSVAATFALWRPSIRFVVTPKTRAGRRIHIGFLLPWAIGLANLTGLAMGAWDIATGHGSRPAATTLIVMGWALFSLSTAVGLLSLNWRCNHERRETTRFPFERAVQLTAEDGKTITTIATALSADGISLRTSLPVARDWRGTAMLDGKPHSFTLRAVPSRRGGALAWDTPAARDAAEHALMVERIAHIARFDAVDRATFLQTPQNLLDRLRQFRETGRFGWRSSI